MTTIGMLIRSVLILIVYCAAPPGWAQPDESVPLGLPSLSVGASTSREIRELGRALFFDRRLSTDGTISCASCHQPSKAFADARMTSIGVNGRIGSRNTPTLLNVVFNKTFFWDGRGDRLARNSLDPLFNPAEHGLAGFDEVKRHLVKDSRLPKLFSAAFRKPASEALPSDIGGALSAYLGTLVAGDSPFDRYHFGNDRQAMSSAAVRGFELFRGKARCVTCHTIQEKWALFSDQEFHTLGIGTTQIARMLPQLSVRARTLEREKLGHAVVSEPGLAALGRYVVTNKPADIGKFRTPSLRNVALTAPYMHDGSVPTLEQAIELELNYRNLSAGQPILVSPQDKTDLVEFLRALTSVRLPAAAEFNQRRP